MRNLTRTIALGFHPLNPILLQPMVNQVGLYVLKTVLLNLEPIAGGFL